MYIVLHSKFTQKVKILYSQIYIAYIYTHMYIYTQANNQISQSNKLEEHLLCAMGRAKPFTWVS